MSDGWVSGSFNISVDMSANDAAGIPIVSSAFSRQKDTIVAGIDNCIAKDGQNTPTANLPMGNFRHTGAGKPVDTTDYDRLNERVHHWPVYARDLASAGGQSITVSVSVDKTITGSAGFELDVLIASDKPRNEFSRVILHYNGLSADIVGPAGVNLWPGALSQGVRHKLSYNEDTGKFVLGNPLFRWNKTSKIYAGRLAAGTVRTVAAGFTLTVTAGVMRFHDMAMYKLNNPSMVYAVSLTTEQLVLGSVPDYAKPTETQYGPVRGGAGGSSDPIPYAYAKISTDGKVVIDAGKDAGGTQNNLRTLGVISNFQMFYRLD